jgi:hypothetical protein
MTMNDAIAITMAMATTTMKETIIITMALGNHEHE